MKFHAVLPAGFCAVLLLFLGCATTRPGGMSIAVLNLRPLDPSLSNKQATLTLRYVNESVAPYGIARSQHKLYLNGKYVGEAVSNRPLGIPPTEAATQEVVLKVDNVPAVQEVFATKDTRTVAYRLESVVYETIGDEKVQTKTSSSGALDLRERPGEARR